MTVPSTSKGALLLDGAQYEDALAWLYQSYPSHQPLPLLSSTAYELIAVAGPILIDAPVGSPAYSAWSQGGDMPTAIWLQGDTRAEDLVPILQRRLRIFAPDGREFWLRLADSLPLRQVWLASAQWPDGFWHGVSGVWFRHQGEAICAWVNAQPELDIAPATTGITAQITLDWPVLQALAAPFDTAQEV